MYALLEIWRYRRVWMKMIILWEKECKRNGAIRLQPGESIEVKMPLVHGNSERIERALVLPTGGGESSFSDRLDPAKEIKPRIT